MIQAARAPSDTLTRCEKTFAASEAAQKYSIDASSNPARLADNAEWLNAMTAMEFLRDVGKYFTVNYLLAKESVKRRIESEDGISYTEFSYSLLQAFDFLVLHDRFGCRLQIGGSDQWGNIVAGTDLVRSSEGRRPRAGNTAADHTGERSSARPRPARCGWILSARRRSASTSSG